MVKNQSVKWIGDFEVYLEGIKVPFTSVAISEAEETIPSATITFPGFPQALRLLAGTIVQVFGPTTNIYTGNNKQLSLLFEGEITGISHNATSSGQAVAIRATSLLSHLISAKLRPTDIMVSKQQQDSEILNATNAVIRMDPIGKNTPGGMLGPTIVESLGELIQKKQDASVKVNILKDTLANIGAINTIGGLASTFAKLLKDGGAASTGNFQEIISEFNTLFEVSDLYYGVTSLSLHIGASIFAFPNDSPSSAFKVRCVLEAYENFQKYSEQDMFNSDERITLMACLGEFQKYLNYRFTVPAAPTGAKLFYQNTRGTKEQYFPLRAFYMPHLESGPPMLCNIIFPEQLTQSDYQRDMLSEPTRLLARAQFRFTSNTPDTYMPMQVVPDIGLKLSPNDKTTVTKFTDEESYRGITLRILPFDGIISKIFYRDNKDKTDGKSVTNEPKLTYMEQGMGDVMRDFAYEDYLNQKYGNRTVAIQTEWNPYRLVGAPGMVFFPGRPTMVGIVSALQTQITANGNAVSSITFRNTRIIFDEDMTSPFANALKNKDNKTGLERYVIDDMSQEGISCSNETLFDQELYGFSNIGEDVYAYLVEGLAGKTRRFEKYGTSLFKDYQNNLNKDAFPTGRFHDYSILRFIKDPNSSQVNYYNDVLEAVKPWSDTEINELKYSKLLIIAIRKLKSIYKDIVSSDISTSNPALPSAIDQFIDSVTWRRIISKDDYLSFIGALNKEGDFYMDAKDFIGILNSADLAQQTSKKIEYTLHELRADIQTSSVAENKGIKLSDARGVRMLEIINDNIMLLTAEIEELERSNPKNKKALKDKKARLKEQQKKLEKYSKNLTTDEGKMLLMSSPAAIFRPYNITRRAHVQFIFAGLQAHDKTKYIDNTSIIEV